MYKLPKDLPVPIDDGTSDHLWGVHVPAISLRSTANQKVCLAELSQHQRTVVYCYPFTGRPRQELPKGWNEIPGARGCTPESCAFRDHYRELQALQTHVFGLSTQTTEYQQELVQRIHLPFELLSDSKFTLTKALKLPTFEVDFVIFIKRLTLVIFQGCIEKVFYPVFPPDNHADEVIDWLSQNPQHQANREIDDGI